MYTKSQQKLLRYTRNKVKVLFADFTMPAHDYTHAARVARWAVQIARSEKANVFLCEIVSLLHDIGRTTEPKNPGVSHHELSYEMCREWFRDDRTFDAFSKQEKLLILYAIRFHWNDAADKYIEAVILRDADKLDAGGVIGLRRAIQHSGGDEKRLQLEFRIHYQLAYMIQTRLARKIAKDKKMLAPFDRAFWKFLKARIPPVSL